MAEIFQLVGVLVTIYFLAVKIVMLWKQCPEEEAKEMIASGIPPKAKESDSILDTGLIDKMWVVIQLVDEVLYTQLQNLAASFHSFIVNSFLQFVFLPAKIEPGGKKIRQ